MQLQFYALGVVHGLQEPLLDDLHSAEGDFPVDADCFHARDAGQWPVVELHRAVQCVLDVVLEVLEQHLHLHIAVCVVVAGLLKLLP